MRKNLVFTVLLILASATVMAQPPVPQLPNTYINTTYSAPTGMTWAAHSSTDLKNALLSANPGDIIVLDAGATYIGNFTLPVKANPNNKWIYIISSAMASLPAPGTRINPTTDAVHMPKIVTPNAIAAVTITPAAHHYRLAGLEIFSASTVGCQPNSIPPINCYSYQLVSSGSKIGDQLVDSITVDRCYLHGSPTQDVKQGVIANGTNFAVVDSYISDIHQSTNDSQAIVAYYTPGPIKIVDNFLSATTEDVMFGGAGGLKNPYVPSDIEFRNNHLYKPLTWAKTGVTLPPHNQWSVKDNFELKSARRVLVDGNIIENIWVSAQMGYSLMLTPRPSSSGSNAVVDDITISNNVLENVSSGVDTAEIDSNCKPANGCNNPGEMRRVKLYNNLIMLGNTTQSGYSNGNDYGILIEHGLIDFEVQHTTVLNPPNLGDCNDSIFFNSIPPYTPPTSNTTNVWVLDNVLCRQIHGNHGWIGQSADAIYDYMGQPSPEDARMIGNVAYAPSSDAAYSMPPHNYVSTVPLLYVDPKNANYQLLSPRWMDTSDGKIAGVDSSNLPSNLQKLH